MKRLLLILIALWIAQATLAMTGGPFFCVGQQMTSMTVEASKVHMEMTSPTSTERAAAVSDRIGLTSRFGLRPGVDFSATLGAATLQFSNLEQGFSNFEGAWSFAWGAGLQAGYPFDPKLYQAVVSVDYFGYMPKGKISNGIKTINSKYQWHEITPRASVGFRLGSVVPYAGAMKPYLFGKQDVTVDLRGQAFSAANGRNTYSDGKQELRGFLGIEWRLPQGYSIGAEGATTPGGIWTLVINVAQVLK
jgi:hypothetical protein